MVPLVGSGLSQASGMASWDEIISVLKRLMAADSTLNISSIDLDTFEAPDAYRSISGHQSLVALIEEAVGRGFKPNSLHALLADIPFRTCLTTNWDSLLEDSLIEARRVNVIFDDDTARTWRESQANQIIKFHGTIQSPKSIVFGLSDYSRLYQQPSILMSLVRTLLATRPILSLGFGMRDPFLKSIFHAVGNDVRHEHFIVVSNTHVDKLRRRYLEELGLVVIEVDSSADDPYGLGLFLKELRLKTYTEARNRIDRMYMILRETSRLQLYLGADRCVRVRASMGPLAFPDTNDLNAFGGNEVYQIQSKLLDVLLEFISIKRGKLRLICSPLDGGEHSARKGYSIEAHRARLRALVKWVDQLENSIELVMTSRPSDLNDFIVADMSLIESRKSYTKDGRLYEYARLEVNPNAVSTSVRRFDEEFDNIAAISGGVDESRKRFLKLAQQEIDS